ncbi:acetoacetate decarboxylase [Sulfolobus acidocaldarius SUSAZ]|nr:acetoacetate decarboxylase [Sulfolobus acidocaldarius SUSAZ]
MNDNLLTYPFTRSGKSAIVPPPPWYYGVTYISAYVKFQKDTLYQFLPNFLDSEGEGWIYVAEFISPSEETWDLMYQDPDLTQYLEGAIGLRVYYEGKSYLYFPFMWVDKDWALVRGWLDGYPKKIAKISMTKLHPLLPKYSKPEKGLRLGGYVVRGGNFLFRLQVELREKVDDVPLRNFGAPLNIRIYPARGESETNVFELVSRVRDENVLGEIWKGDAKIELGGYVNDELDKLKIEDVIAGYYYTTYFKVRTTRLLAKLERNIV